MAANPHLDRALQALKVVLAARPGLRIGQALAIALGPQAGGLSDEELASALEAFAGLSSGRVEAAPVEGQARL